MNRNPQSRRSRYRCCTYDELICPRPERVSWSRHIWLAPVLPNVRFKASALLSHPVLRSPLGVACTFLVYSYTLHYNSLRYSRQSFFSCQVEFARNRSSPLASSLLLRHHVSLVRYLILCYSKSVPEVWDQASIWLLLFRFWLRLGTLGEKIKTKSIRSLEQKPFVLVRIKRVETSTISKTCRRPKKAREVPAA